MGGQNLIDRVIYLFLGGCSISLMKTKPKTITLIGAGLNGPLLSILLRQRGFAVEIYERRPDMREVRVNAGRSINLALSTRGIHTLKLAGLWSEMQKIIIPMRGRMMHSIAGELTFQPYGKNDAEVINSISRSELNIALVNAAEEQGASIHFNQRCTDYDLKTGLLRLHDEEKDTHTNLQADVVIACDGSASAVRSEMLRLNRFNFSQQYLDYGYKELTIPAGSSGEHLLDSHALHIWPRGNYMLIALPNIDGTFACILFLPFEGADSFSSLTAESEVVRFFESRFPDAFRLMPQIAHNYFANPTGTMITIKCSPWQVEGRSLLLGDAAHAIVPFFGQGLNAGFEDCACLINLLDDYGDDWQRVFHEFEIERKLNTDAIADMAIENFTEMRDRVADTRFLFRKKVELALEAKFPKRFVPKYAMVTFLRVPYSVAMARGVVQDRILAQLCDAIDRVEDLDWEKAAQLICRDLSPLEIN